MYSFFSRLLQATSIFSKKKTAGDGSGGFEFCEKDGFLYCETRIGMMT
jgi:hypothetical protein